VIPARGREGDGVGAVVSSADLHVVANSMQRPGAHPSRPDTGRTLAGRVSARGVSSLAATTADTFPAALKNEPSAVGAFYQGR